MAAEIASSGPEVSEVASASVPGRALVVAVAGYPTSPLPTAVLNDATDVAAVLGSSDYCGFSLSQVRTLIDSQATLFAIRAGLAELATQAQPDETVVIYFSGHGVRFKGKAETSALAPFDADVSNLAETTLPEAEFSAALAAIRAKRLLVLIDACHSGGVGVLKGLGAEADFGFTDQAFKRLATGTGRVLIAASKASETSIIMQGARNSVFTTHLLAALRGGTPPSADGLVRVFEIFNYVSEHVQAALPGRQHPIFKASDLETNFPVALWRGGAKSMAVADLPAQPASLDEILAALYPMGPVDQDIWLRAGGDLSRLKLTGTGRANWFAAIRMLDLGGGGASINRRKLVTSALDDYPHHARLQSLAD